MAAASCTAERRVSRTPRRASVWAPNAAESVKVAGSAAGIRGKQHGQGERDEIARRQRHRIGVNDDADRHRRVHEREIPRRRKDGGLLGAGGMGRAHELGGAPEIGPRSRRRDFRDRLAAAYQRARIDRIAGICIDRNGFPGEHGLVHHHRSGHDACIGGHQRPERKRDGVAGHQFGRRQLDPFAVAAGERRRREAFLERRQRRAGAAFLDQTQNGVEQEQTGDHRRFDVFPEPGLDNHRGFEQPRDGRPEFRQKSAPARRRFFTDRVGTKLGKPPARFVAGQADWTADRGLAFDGIQAALPRPSRRIRVVVIRARRWPRSNLFRPFTRELPIAQSLRPLASVSGALALPNRSKVRTSCRPDKNSKNCRKERNYADPPNPVPTRAGKSDWDGIGDQQKTDNGPRNAIDCPDIGMHWSSHYCRTRPIWSFRILSRACVDLGQCGGHWRDAC